MSSKRKHIDELFKEGLKSLSLLVTDKDLDAIDGKTSVFKDANTNTEKGAFDNFELEVTEFDWQATKAKLDKEKSQLEVDDTVGAKFKGFEVQPDPEDWDITYKKYKDAKRKRVAMWWWLSTGIVLLVAGLSVMLMGNEKSDDMASAPSIPTVIEKNDYDKETIQNDKSKSVDENNVSGKDIGHAQEEVNATNNSNQIQVTPNTSGHSLRHSNSKVNRSSNYKNDRFNKLVVVNEPKVEVTSFFEPNKEKFLKTDKDFSKLKKSDIQPPDRILDLNPETDTKRVEQPELPIIPEPSADSTKKDEPEKDNNKGPDGPVPPPMLGWYMGAVTQVAYTSRVLGSSNNQMYNSIRNNGDKGFMQLGFGFEFGYRMKKDQVSIGAQLTEQNWSSHYSYSYRVYDSIPFIDINGNVTYFLFRGRDTVMDESVNIKISRIELPFRYDRRITVSDKLDLSLGFGAVFGINSAFKGNRLVYPGNIQMYPYQRWSSMERRFTVSPSISVGGQYKINDRYILHTDLNGSMYAMSRFKPAFGAQDFPYSIGLNIKLIYLLK